MVKSALKLRKADKLVINKKLQISSQECYDFGQLLGKNLLYLQNDIRQKKEIFSNPSTLLEYYNNLPEIIRKFFLELIEILLKK